MTGRPTTTKPLLLGEAPGRGGDASTPLGGRVAETLCALAGFDPEPDARSALAERFDLANLLDEYPGPAAARGARFPLAEAREAADALDLDGRVVVLLGHRVAAAVGFPNDYFVFGMLRGAMMVVVPHPSGVNRALNDPLTRARAGAALRAAAEMG